MHITTLQLSGFRNLRQTSLSPSPRCTIFYGENGAGKTSLLEAIYYLGLGRSFRTSQHTRLIQNKEQEFSLFAELLDSRHNKTAIGIARSREGARRIRHNGENIASIAPLAQLLPMQLISTDSYRYFHDGPKTRRQFLNWGLFHTEVSFYPLWQELLSLLKQRNAALKSKRPLRELSAWTPELIRVSSAIHAVRQIYVSALEPILQSILDQLIGHLSLRLEYARGWPEDIDFEAQLKAQHFKDQAIGYTSSGPQRADLQIFIEDVPAQDHLSQGQQKLAAYALHLAQGALLQKTTGKQPIYLIDDLPSELDPSRRACVTQILSDLNAQTFITGITLNDLNEVLALEKALLFHVEHGEVTLANTNDVIDNACSTQA